MAVLIREVPEIDAFVDNIWKSGTDGNLKTGGNGGSRVAPVFPRWPVGHCDAVGENADSDVPRSD